MPTITARLFDYETLKSRLKAEDRIVIVSCNSCARQSDNLGGEQGLQKLAGKLADDGFNVVHRELMPIACHPGQWKELLDDKRLRALFDKADVIIPLSCQAGEKRMEDMLPGLRLFRVTRTLGKGVSGPDGARLTEPGEGVDIRVDSPEGIPLAEAAGCLGLHAGSF